MSERILMVDDDRELVELVSEYLRREGFVVDAVFDGENGVERALNTEYSLVVLDVMLPGIGGFEVLRRIRAANTTAARVPVLMLTARGEEIDRVMGLEWGADDYLAKPHSPRELLARVRATLRRVQLDRDESAAPTSASSAMHYVLGEIELDGAARSVQVAGEPIELTSVEFDLLALLMRHAGEVVTRETITREVFDRPLLHLDRGLDVHISNLRRKLSTQAENERIKTVRGIGYIFTR